MEDCTTAFGNTGAYEKCSSFKATRGYYIVPVFADDGTENKIPAGTELTEAFLTSQLSNTDSSKRWYPLINAEAVASERGDDKYYDYPSGAREFIAQGIKNVTFELRQRGPEFLGQIKTCACEELAFFAIDLEGNLRGSILGVDEVSDFYPTKIQPATFSPNLIEATEDAPERLKVQFQVEINEKDDLLRVYPKSLVTAKLLKAKGLYDVYMDVSNITATGFTASLRTIYTDGDKFRPTGLVAGDFALYNKTDSVAITITTVAESSPGVYVFVHPTTVTSKVRRLTPTKPTFDFSKVVANTFFVAP